MSSPCLYCDEITGRKFKCWQTCREYSDWLKVVQERNNTIKANRRKHLDNGYRWYNTEGFFRSKDRDTLQTIHNRRYG